MNWDIWWYLKISLKKWPGVTAGKIITILILKNPTTIVRFFFLLIFCCCFVDFLIFKKCIYLLLSILIHLSVNGDIWWHLKISLKKWPGIATSKIMTINIFKKNPTTKFCWFFVRFFLLILWIFVDFLLLLFCFLLILFVFCWFLIFFKIYLHTFIYFNTSVCDIWFKLPRGVLSRTLHTH